MDKLLSFENVPQLMILISQIDNEQKDNLLTIFRFLNECELPKENKQKDDYQKVEKKYYAPLVVYVNQRNDEVEVNTPDFWDLNKIRDNILSTVIHIEILTYFIKLAPYEQKNLLNIVKFIIYCQKNNPEKKTWGDVSRNNWSRYIHLIRRIKLVITNEEN